MWARPWTLLSSQSSPFFATLSSRLPSSPSAIVSSSSESVASTSLALHAHAASSDSLVGLSKHIHTPPTTTLVSLPAVECRVPGLGAALAKVKVGRSLDRSRPPWLDAVVNANSDGEEGIIYLAT